MFVIEEVYTIKIVGKTKNKQGEMTMKQHLRITAIVLLFSIFISTTIFANKNTKLIINNTATEMPSALSIKEGYIPLRWMVQKMGASKVIWEKETVTVEIPSFLEMHQYVSYLRGLNTVNENHYPLPERYKEFNFPTAEFVNYDAYIEQKPLTINITSNGFSMPWTLYDYEIIDGTLYVDHRWLNTLFLADTKYDARANTIEVTYMPHKELQDNISEIEKAIAPIEPEEALALWIKGQQVRSGSLQYAALSPLLKQKAMTAVKNQGWVTGGSSPSLGKATVLETKKIDENTISYVIEYDEMLSGSIYNKFKQTITIQKQVNDHTENWLITQVDNNNSYYTILPDENQNDDGDIL